MKKIVICIVVVAVVVGLFVIAENQAQKEREQAKIITPTKIDETQNGTVDTGRIGLRSGVHVLATIGPTCPVMRVPPDDVCKDKPYEGTFRITRMGNTGGSPEVNIVKTDASGKGTLSLFPGTYQATLQGSLALPTLQTTTFVVVENTYTDIALSLDSGIR